jgi:hypothetical protein
VQILGDESLEELEGSAPVGEGVAKLDGDSAAIPANAEETMGFSLEGNTG